VYTTACIHLGVYLFAAHCNTLQQNVSGNKAQLTARLQAHLKEQAVQARAAQIAAAASAAAAAAGGGSSTSAAAAVPVASEVC
jgi:hypothetical protein